MRDSLARLSGCGRIVKMCDSLIYYHFKANIMSICQLNSDGRLFLFIIYRFGNIKKVFFFQIVTRL